MSGRGDDRIEGISGMAGATWKVTVAEPPPRNNLDIWQKVAQPPPDALKEIKGGRMSGKTDISPQWRMKAMTELFGPCGIGWKWAIEKLWTEPGPGGEVMAFALVNVWISDDSRNNIAGGPVHCWSDPIPGIGGNALVASEYDRNTNQQKLRSNDEAYKMAVTDALSVAFKSLGVAADIYAGKWDGTKYKDAPDGPKLEGPRKIERPPAIAQPGHESGVKAALQLTGDDDPLLNETERKKLFAMLKDIPTEAQRVFLAETWGLRSRSELRRSHLVPLVAWIKQQKGDVA